MVAKMPITTSYGGWLGGVPTDAKKDNTKSWYGTAKELVLTDAMDYAYLWGRAWFETGKMGQTGQWTLAFIDENNVFIAGIALSKSDKVGNNAVVYFLGNDGNGSKIYQSIPFTPSFWLPPNPYGSQARINDRNMFDLRKEGSKITYFFNGKYKPVGTDGLTIVGIEIDERDELGNQLFYSSKASAIIYAVQAKEQFTSKVNGEGYIKKNWTYETKNQNTLAGQALAELKKISQVELTVTIKSYEYLEIGDTVRALNTAYKPELNLSVRVSEQDIYFDQPSKNQTTFTNVEILKSEVDTSLLDRVQALIDANKVFTYEIITSDGVTFKNGFGSTTLTARVRDGIKDVTDTFSLKWYKNGTLFSNTKIVTINAADIEEKAVFRFEVADDSGNVRGGAEVTVTNIDDGKKGEPGKSPYNVVLISSNGLLFKNGVVSTAIQAVVFQGDEDVTDLLDANQFKWKKTNGDGTPDEAWNALHAGGVKSVTIGTDDVNKRATFSCDIVEI
ncbi:hypothetical protein [Enterococcus casseliflavus]|uniref:hypothetical protein n=1 Tax=Enterococcus casseliflavus TaxID=37734 RepID=UPI0037C57888